VQERQHPTSSPAGRATHESRSRRLWRSHRTKVMAGLGAIGLSLFVLGCPQAGDLQDAETFCKPDGSVIGGSGVISCKEPTPMAGGSGGMAMAGCETACMAAIIGNGTMACKTCHGVAVKLDMSSLDLETPGYGARLKDHPAEHKGNAAGTVCPSGDKLIDSATPANSWLLKKVTSMQGSCGVNMPLGGMLSPADQMCVQTFVTCVAMSGAPAGGGGMPSGGAATGGGGTGGVATGGGGGSGGGAKGGGGSGGASTGGGGSGGSGGAKGGTGGTGGV
jgi:hypothetical protein